MLMFKGPEWPVSREGCADVGRALASSGGGARLDGVACEPLVQALHPPRASRPDDRPGQKTRYASTAAALGAVAVCLPPSPSCGAEPRTMPPARGQSHAASLVGMGDRPAPVNTPVVHGGATMAATAAWSVRLMRTTPGRPGWPHEPLRAISHPGVAAAGLGAGTRCPPSARPTTSLGARAQTRGGAMGGNSPAPWRPTAPSALARPGRRSPPWLAPAWRRLCRPDEPAGTSRTNTTPPCTPAAILATTPTAMATSTWRPGDSRGRGRVCMPHGAGRGSTPGAAPCPGTPSFRTCRPSRPTSGVSAGTRGSAAGDRDGRSPCRPITARASP